MTKPDSFKSIEIKDCCAICEHNITPTNECISCDKHKFGYNDFGFMYSCDDFSKAFQNDQI